MMKSSSIEACVMVVVLLMVGGVTGTRVFVGNKDGWKPGVNYTIWASQQTLYAGDWLEFMFDKNMYDVLEVNKTFYDFCKSEVFIANITKGGRDVYQLKEARTYYFICSKGYCFNGMKLAIDVKQPPPPPPPPSSQANYVAGPSLYGGNNMNVIAVYLVLATSVLLLFSLK